PHLLNITLCKSVEHHAERRDLGHVVGELVANRVDPRGLEGSLTGESEFLRYVSRDCLTLRDD
ncbi:hypothetical protein PENTCL1PPCAC_4645, partial [Pristionchus entomophagus]